jgi:hypothetical protein
MSTRHRKLHAACCAVASTQNIRPPDCLDSRLFLTANKLRIAKYSVSPISYKSQSSVPESKGTLFIRTTIEKNSPNSHNSLPSLHPRFTSPALASASAAANSTPNLPAMFWAHQTQKHHSIFVVASSTKIQIAPFAPLRAPDAATARRSLATTA